MLNILEKNNQVLWNRWDDTVLKRAETENKAIFLTIGYDSCHWCQVMEDKVFKNQECIDILNNNFICIKVDKNERADLDKYYQNVHQLLNNRAGGYPTSVFSTPQNKPFFAGTYIAVESEVGSIEGMGFLELTKLISEKITNNEPTLYENADEVEQFLDKVSHPKEATVLKEDFVKNFMVQVKNNYQTKEGGFSVAPKFPHANTLKSLIFIDQLYDDKAAKAMVVNTLDFMKKGGFYDLEKGGFYRYSLDSSWREPYLEKMLYDNALLSEVYAEAYKSYKDDSYLEVAKRCVEFWLDDLSENNLFYSSCYGSDEIDKKIQTSYSSMMIKTLFKLGEIEKKYKIKAKESLKTLLKTLYIDNQLYHFTLINQEPTIKAFLEDYAFLSQALISAYQTTKEEVYLIDAQRFTNTALEKFYKNGAWNFSCEEFIVKADIYDNTYTSAISVMVEVMLSLGSLLKDEKYTHFAFKTMEYNSFELGRKPVHSPMMLIQVLRYLEVRSSEG